MYNKRIWVNSENSPSTGSVVAYHGPANWGNSKEDRKNDTFFEVSDCHTRARLHRSRFETEEEFIKKMELVRDAAAEFIFYLKNKEKPR